MKRKSLVYALLFALPAVYQLSGHSQEAATQRDPQALTILTQAFSAAGGQSLLSSIQDFVETGNATFYWGDGVSGSITVKSRGLHQFRLDAELPEGHQSTVVNGSGGLLTETNGSIVPIFRQSAADLGSLTLPYLPLVAAIADPSMNVKYSGIVTHNSASLLDIRIEKAYTSQQDPTGLRGAREGRDIYVDPKSFLIVAISDQIFFGPQDEGVPHEILYSNYQSENGVAMPLTVTETTRGVASVTIELSQVTFNTGLADADFLSSN